jgi:hypothetical protein
MSLPKPTLGRELINTLVDGLPESALEVSGLP